VETEAKKSLWAEGIKSSFDSPNPLACPWCKKTMETQVIFSYQAKHKEQILKTKYDLMNGYFYLRDLKKPP